MRHGRRVGLAGSSAMVRAAPLPTRPSLPPQNSSFPPSYRAPHSANKFFGAFRGWLLAPPAEEADKKAAFLAALADLDAAMAAAKGPLFGGASMNATDAALAPKLYHALTALKHWKAFDVYAQPGQFEAVKLYQLALAEVRPF